MNAFTIIYLISIILILSIFTAINSIKKNNKVLAQNELLRLETCEKEKKIKQANHRIKNNLQLINSLLRLQAKEYKSSDIDKFLSKGQKRIDSVILLHQSFAESNNDSSTIDLVKYIKDLFKFLMEAYEIDADKITLNINSENTNAEIETILPLGIILNELICNSILHAFPNKPNNNKIEINIIRESKSNFILTYNDNGIGFNPISKSGLGLKIIDLLTNQINADYSFYNNGTSFKLVFTMKTLS